MSNVWYIHCFWWDPTLQNSPYNKSVTVIDTK